MTEVKVTQASRGKLRPEAANKVRRFGGQTRYLWNLFVAMNNARIAECGKFVFYAELSPMLPRLLKEDPKLEGLPHRCAQMRAQSFERTLRHYIRHKAEFQRVDAKRKAKSAARVAAGLPPLKPKKSGIPQFQARDDKSDTFSFVGREVRLAPARDLTPEQEEKNQERRRPRFVRPRIRLPKLGWLRVQGLDVPPDADVKQAVVSQAPDGWFVSVQFDAKVRVKEQSGSAAPVTGIDRGLSTLVDLIDEKVKPPRHGKTAEERIRWLNRKRDRRRLNSVNRRRVNARLGKLHRHVRNQRQDFLHKLTSRMVDRFEGFAVEDLNVKGLMKTRLAKSFADASLGELLRMLRYKAEWACREWRVLGRFRRSTGVCPDCGWIGPRLRPGIESWTCGGCGAVHDRDTAAARVILRDATVARAAGVAPVCREPVCAYRRKRGIAVVGGGEAGGASTSRHGPPANVADAHPGE